MTAAEKIARLAASMTPDNVDEVLRRAGEVDASSREASVLLEGLIMQAEALRSPEGRAAWERQERERREVEAVERRHE